MSTTPYLDLAGYKSLALLPSDAIDEINAANPGWFAATLAERTAHIESRLRKRYNVDAIAAAPNDTVKGWLARLVDRLALKKRGYVPDDPSALEVITDETTAKAEIKEAADSVDGLFDLPLAPTGDTSGIAKGGPLGYSEASPFVGYDRQFRAAVDEDINGMGSGDAVE